MVDHTSLEALGRHKLEFVSALGVVVEYSIPRKCCGTDIFMSLKIIDEGAREVTVNMFKPYIVNFPVIRAAGDIVFLRGVEVLIYGNEPYLRGDRKSNWWMFDGAPFGSCNPYFSSEAGAFSSSLYTAIERLRHWRLLTLNNVPSVYDVSSIKDLRDNTYLDLLGKVVHICKCDGQMLLYFWDGTDAPSQSINPMFGEHYYSKSPVPNNDFDQLPNSVVREFPEAGTILKVAVQIDDNYLARHFHFINRWIKVRSIFYQSIDSLWKASSSKLKIRLLEQSDPSVLERTRNFENRVNEKSCIPMSYDPMASQVTEIISSRSECHLSTLLSIRAAPVGMMFKCIVRVVCFGPTADDIIFKLTIEDPTTRVCAFTTPMERIHLFSGVKNERELLDKFKKLIGYPENYEECRTVSPPWIPCIIRTTLENPNDPDENRTYHLVCTKFA